MADKKDISMTSGGSLILIVLMLLGLAVTIYRMAVGLGGATNLNDNYPWGLWVGIDVLTGVALAAGGFTITAAVYVFNWKKYKPITRPAILTAFIGYLMVIVGLVIDIGKPHTFWHPLVMWQYHSIMFEVVWCITLYTAVLALEFSPMYFERTGKKGAVKTIRKFLFPIVIAGIILSYFHQSSLGAFYLITPAKTHPLWWSRFLPQLFYLSAIAVGLAMVSFEAILSSRVFKRPFEMDILSGLGRGTAIVLLIYLIAKFADLAGRGSLPLIFEGSKASIFFLLEIVGGVILPMVLLFSGGIRQSVNGILFAQVLVIAGVVLNRLNVTFFTQSAHGGSYFPSWMEFAVTVGLVSLGIFLYRLAVKHLAVFEEPKTQTAKS